MLLSSREAVTPCCPCFVSFRLPAFPGDDPCDLFRVLLEFDVKGLVAKNGGLFSNKYDPLPPLRLNLEPTLSQTFKLAYWIFHFSFLSLALYLFVLCITGSSFLWLPAPWSCLSSLPGYLMYYFSLQGLRVEMKYGRQASTGMLIFCVITSGWGPGLGSVSINLCLSLAPAAFWNPILPMHRGETMTHDLSHR